MYVGTKCTMQQLDYHSAWLGTSARHTNLLEIRWEEEGEEVFMVPIGLAILQISYSERRQCVGLAIRELQETYRPLESGL